MALQNVVAVAVACSRASVRFADGAEVIDFTVTTPMDWYDYPTQIPRTKPAVPLAVVDAAYESASIIANAQARQSAVDLASGRGRLAPNQLTGCESDDGEEWAGAPIHQDEDRRRPIVWRGESSITIDEPMDGYASYGRSRFSFTIRHRDRTKAIEWLAPRWDDYRHVGNVPADPASALRHTIAELPNVPNLVPRKSADACPVFELGTVPRWLMDTGCGFDLVSESDALSCKMALGRASTHVQHSQRQCQSQVRCHNVHRRT